MVFRVNLYSPLLYLRIPQFILRPYYEHGVIRVTEFVDVGFVFTQQLIEGTQLTLH